MTDKKKKTKEQYDKPVSLYTLKPEDALAAFMKVKPEKVIPKKRNRKK